MRVSDRALTKKLRKLGRSAAAEPVYYPVRIVNIVCTAWAGCKVSIVHTALTIHGRLGQQVFPACVSRARETRTNNSQFETGRIVVTGAKDVETAKLSAYLFFDRIRRDLKVDVAVYNFEIQNVVGSFGLGYKLNLDLFFMDHKVDQHSRKMCSSYQPDRFRGLTWRPGKITFVIFDSGMVVITGGKSIEQLHEEYMKYVQYFRRYESGKEYKEVDVNRTRSRQPALNLAEV